jgi:hypothetical protein
LAEQVPGLSCLYLKRTGLKTRYYIRRKRDVLDGGGDVLFI